MEVRPGYKQTEVGMIPEDWEVKSFTDIGHIKTGPFGTLLKADEYYADEGVPLVSVRDIGEGLLTFDDHTPLVPPSVLRRLPEYVLNCGDIVFGRKGGVDRSAIVQESQAGCFLGSDGIRIRPSKAYHAEFVAYELQRKEIQTWLLQNATGTTMASMNQEILRRISLPFPPLREQRAIAGALEDVDALISALERLIAKKRDLKQAAMQQLLTGQTRLPGFHGKWVVKELGELGEISGAGVDKKVRPGEIAVRLVNYLDVYRKNFIYSRDLSHVVSAPAAQAARCSVRKGDIFFTPSSEMPYDVAVSAVAVEDIPDATYSYHVVRLRLVEDWDLLFRGYAFKWHQFLTQAARACEGSGVRYVITQSRFRQLSVCFPPTREEQVAIGEVLWDMDSEIATLEARLSKTRALKQGMMQELLTGRIRLTEQPL